MSSEFNYCFIFSVAKLVFVSLQMNDKFNAYPVLKYTLCRSPQPYIELSVIRNFNEKICCK